MAVEGMQGGGTRKMYSVRSVGSKGRCEECWKARALNASTRPSQLVLFPIECSQLGLQEL